MYSATSCFSVQLVIELCDSQEFCSYQVIMPGAYTSTKKAKSPLDLIVGKNSTFIEFE